MQYVENKNFKHLHVAANNTRPISGIVEDICRKKMLCLGNSGYPVSYDCVYVLASGEDA